MVTATFVASGWGVESWFSSVFGLLAVAASSTGAGVAAANFYRQSKRQQAAESEQLVDLRKALDESAVGGRDIVIWGSGATAQNQDNEDEDEDDQAAVRAMRRRTSTTYQILTDHYANTLRESRAYFYLSYVVGLLGFIVMLVGVGVVYGGSLDSGILAAVVGVVVEGAAGLVFTQGRKAKGDSQQNLQGLAETMQQDNNRDIALHLVGLIQDPDERDRAIGDLARRAMSSAAGRTRQAPDERPELPEGRPTVPSVDDYPKPGLHQVDGTTA